MFRADPRPERLLSGWARPIVTPAAPQPLRAASDLRALTAGRPRRHRVVDGGTRVRVLDPLPESLQRRTGTQVVARRYSLARFFQVDSRCRQVGSRLFEPGTGHTRPLGRGQLGAAFRHERSDFSRGVVHVDSNPRFRVGRAAGRVLGVLATLERVTQRQPVVASSHGGVGVLERLGRRGVLDCCVPCRRRRPA